MNKLNPTATIGELATHHPMSVKVFQRHGIDFCCGGGKRLDEVCDRRNLVAANVIEEIRSEEARATEPAIDWSSRPLDELISFLVAHYHAPLPEELSRLVALARKVHHVHGLKDSGLGELETAVVALEEELLTHLEKEEQILFPVIREGDGAAAGIPSKVLKHEHDDVSRLLGVIRKHAHDFVVPPGACRSWTALIHGLAALEAELQQHIHLENNVLFPRAIGTYRS